MSDGTSALYNVYRPRTFGEVVGQENTLNLLRKHVASNPNHAYLFTGPAGCGKTSTARIFAKSLNCLNREDGESESCNTCDSCVDFDNEESVDFHEYDMGGYGGVDPMRDILSKISSASYGKYKFYHFDEAHKITESAAAALLITLENPPQNTIFILSTTNPLQVSETLVTRCTPARFTRFSPDVLTAHLKSVVAKESIDVSDDVIIQAVSQAKGSMRQAFSELEALSAGQVTPFNFAPALVNALADTKVTSEQRIHDALTIIARAFAAGASLRSVGEETIGLLSDCFLVQMKTPELTTRPDWGQREQAANSLGPKKTVQALEVLGESINKMRSGFDEQSNLIIGVSRFIKMSA